MPAPAEVQPFATYNFELVPGTARDAHTAACQQAAWNNGGILYSTGVAIATIHPREDEVNAAFAALNEKGVDPKIVSIPGLLFNDREEYLPRWELLAPEVQIVAGGLAATLQQVVDADIARSTAEMRRPRGRGQVRIDCTPKDSGAWHVDNLRQTPEEIAFEAGMQRYVVAFGVLGPCGWSPATDFLEGSVAGSDIIGSFRCSSAVQYPRIVTHPVGVVARFDARFGFHRQPAIYGPRIFATTSAVEIAARKVFDDETLD